MFLSRAEVYFEYGHARDSCGNMMTLFSLNLDILCVIVTLRTIVCKDGQLFFELKRLQFLLVDIMRAFYPIDLERGNPWAHELQQE